MGALVQGNIVEGNSPDIQWVSFRNPWHRATMLLE